MTATPLILAKKQAIQFKNFMPDALVWEVLDGQPLLRRGYKDVLKNQKTIEEIMGTSSYQSVITSYLTRLLMTQLDPDKYDVWTAEPGLHLERNNNFSNDIAVHELVAGEKISTKYSDFPPKLAVEVDIAIDPDSMPEIEYLQKKTTKMLDFGVERVVWILTYVRKVIVADRNQDSWHIVDWSADIELMNGITFNIQKFLQKRNINPDTLGK